jgi:glycosyltransferase involved in cell wall biosynthesis
MIFLFQRIHTHYRVPVFEKLNSKLDGKLIFARGQSPKNTYFSDGFGKEFPFKTVQLRNTWFGGEKAVWQNFMKVFRLYDRPEAVICEHSPRILSSYPLLAYCKIKNIPIILWGHGGSRKRSVSKSNALKDKIHRQLIRNSDAYICYTDGIKQELATITNPEKLFVARNSLDTDALFQIRSQLECIGKEKVKESLGLKNKFYLCFIGRLLNSKRADQSLEVYRKLKQRIDNLGLIIIGDGPEKKGLLAEAEKVKPGDIIFTGEISDWEISSKYLYCSDVMVIPQSVGLAINHAFSFGLPVITQQNPTNGPFHGPEIEYITNKRTGFICGHGEIDQMADCARQVIENKAYFTDQVDAYRKNYLSLDIMVDGMVNAIEYARNKS